MFSTPTVALLAIVVLLMLVGVLVVRLRAARVRARSSARRMAMVTGHPSAGGMGKGAGWSDRRALADAAAHHLAGMGLVVERVGSMPIVRANGLAGDYILTVTGRDVLAEYEGHHGGDRVILGEFPGINGAVREIAAHVDRPATV